MPSSKLEIAKQFKELGLSNNEVEAYLSLINKGKSNIQKISKETKIPRSTLYETLKALIEKGLIAEIIEDKKKFYKAYSLKILKNKFEDEQERLQKNLEQIDSLENTISSLGIFSNNKENHFEIRKYSGRSGARQLIWNTLSAKSTVYVYSYFGRTKYVGVKYYQGFVIESKKRDIKEKVIINPSQRVFDLFKRDVGTSKARTKLEDIRCIDFEKLNIQGETFIYDNIFATAYLDKEEIVGFEIESKSFADTQRSIFEAYWQQAKPLKKLL